MTSARQYFLIPSEIIGEHNSGENKAVFIGTVMKVSEGPSCGWEYRKERKILEGEKKAKLWLHMGIKQESQFLQ